MESSARKVKVGHKVRVGQAVGLVTRIALVEVRWLGPAFGSEGLSTLADPAGLQIEDAGESTGQTCERCGDPELEGVELIRGPDDCYRHEDVDVCMRRVDGRLGTRLDYLAKRLDQLEHRFVQHARPRSLGGTHGE